MLSQENSTHFADDILGSDDWERLDDMLNELPAGIPILPSEDATDFSKYRHQPRAYAKGETWANCARALEKHDSDLCKAYREEIDTLLVFAGLFSAVVTAFSVESYRWLQPDPNDAVVGLLAQIAQSVAPNSTTTVTAPNLGGLQPAVSTRINAYWFTSLALSLSSTLVAILCKQWIREFERTVGLSQETYAAIRQIKYEGLHGWKVGDIVSALPLLLQLSLGLFLVGVIELLWRLNVTVAAAVCIPTLLALAFYLATTLLPLIQYLGSNWSMWERISQCPYKSPQAFLAIQFCSLIEEGLTRLQAVARRHMRVFRVYRLKRGRSLPSDHWIMAASETVIRSWSQIDYKTNYRWQYLRHSQDASPGPCFRALYWLRWNVDHGDMPEWIWNCLWDLTVRRTPAFGDVQLRTGSWYLVAGSTPMPDADAMPCARSLALRYAVYARPPPGFVIEAFIHNLPLMNAPGACALISHIEQLHRIPDLETAISLVRAVASFSKDRMGDDLSALFLVMPSMVSRCLEGRAMATLRGSVARTVYNWVQYRAATHDDLATYRATTHALKCIMLSLLADTADFTSYPEKLHDVQHVQELAALTRIYFEASGHAISLPLPKDLWIPYEIGAKTILMELLKLSVPDEVEPSGSSGGQMGHSLPRDLSASPASDIAEYGSTAHSHIGHEMAVVPLDEGTVEDVGRVRVDTDNSPNSPPPL